MTDHPLANLPAPRDITGVNADAFRRLVAEQHVPMVYRGLASEWEIVRHARQSPGAVVNYLKQFDSGLQLPLVVAPAETGGRLFYNDGYDGFNFTRETTTLSEGLDRIIKRSDADDDPFAFFQCLQAARSLPQMVPSLPNPLVPAKTQPGLWIGSRITVAAHFDEAKNVAIVAAGRRRFTLFPPEQINNLYVGRLDFTPAGQPISLVDPSAPDFKNFPRFRAALDAAVSVELGAGDAIYIPAPWWHHVESLEPLNVLVNYWWEGAATASSLPFTALVHAIQAFRHLPSAERSAWKAYVDHYAFETDGDPAAHLASHNPGILAPMTPQLAQHLHRWLIQQIGAGEN